MGGEIRLGAWGIWVGPRVRLRARDWSITTAKKGTRDKNLKENFLKIWYIFLAFIDFIMILGLHWGFVNFYISQRNYLKNTPLTLWLWTKSAIHCKTVFFQFVFFLRDPIAQCQSRFDYAPKPKEISKRNCALLKTQLQTVKDSFLWRSPNAKTFLSLVKALNTRDL